MKSIRVPFLISFSALLAFPFLFSGIAFAAHTPKFTWRVLGGSVNTEQWIYDGEIPLALFEQRVIEQPAENLMFFNGVPKPPVLRHVRLTTDGPPLVECIQLYWVLISGQLVTDHLVNIDVQGNGTPRLMVTFHTRDLSGIAESKRVLNLSYDEKTGSYIYDFEAYLTFNSPEFMNSTSGARGFEFCDPWFTGCPGPAVDFPGMWDRRYTRFVYEANDGLVSLPINHYTTSLKGGIKLRRDGMFLLGYEPDGNPAIQFMGDTADKSGISICWWGYDIHLSRTIAPAEMDRPIFAHYRIVNCPAEKARDMVRDARLPKWTPGQWSLANEYPIYERNSSFTRGLALDGVFEGKTDPFPWTTQGSGGSWDRASGRTDTSSLKISKTEPGLSRWQTFQGDGEGYFAEPWSLLKGYRVSCWVKTENVAGRGATLAVQYHVPNFTQEYPVARARQLTGTQDWTKLELEVGAPPREKAGCLMIMLQQDGSGTTWFDDLEVTPVK
jgi:hypothetical protein